MNEDMESGARGNVCPPGIMVEARRFYEDTFEGNRRKQRTKQETNSSHGVLINGSRIRVFPRQLMVS